MTLLRRLFPLMSACLLTDGCAALLNSERPDYSGPVLRPAWHDASLAVETTPLIYQGVVYVIAKDQAGGRDVTRVFAFDVKNGTKLWSSNFAPKEIITAAGDDLLVSDQGNATHYLDRRTGRESGLSISFSPAKATISDGVLYAVGVTGLVEAWPVSALPREGAPRHVLWQSAAMKREPNGPPVVTNGIVIVAGHTRPDFLTHIKFVAGVYALDAKTGALLWSDEKISGPSISGVAADAGTVFVWKEDRSKNTFGNNILTAFEAATGRQKWERASLTNPGAFPGPMVFSPQVVLSCDYPEGNAGLGDSSGFVYQAFNGAAGEKLWSSQTNWKYRDAIARGELLVVSTWKGHALLNENNNTSRDSWVSVISLRTGKELWRSQEVELSVFTLPAASDGMVVVGSKPFRFNDIAGKPEVAGLWAWPLSK